MSGASPMDELTTPIRSAKRKRAKVNYYEGDSEEAGNESDVYRPEKSQLKAKKARSTSLPRQKTFPFLNLPGEIRNKIYGIVLEDFEGIHLEGERNQCRRTVVRQNAGMLANLDMLANRGGDHAVRGYEYPPAIPPVGITGNELSHKYPRTYKRLSPCLLAVNKQIYCEGRGVLYGGNDFYFQDPFALHSFVVNIGPRNASLLGRITVVTWFTGGAYRVYSHACFTSLLPATNLQRLKILGTIATSYAVDGPKGVARQFYQDAFPWIDAVGVSKGRFDAALDILELSPHNFTHNDHRAKLNDAELEAKNTEKFKEEVRKLLYRHMKKYRAHPRKT